jgi:hypothetical protein
MLDVTSWGGHGRVAHNYLASLAGLQPGRGDRGAQ